jgi:6-phosphogluconolactonase/glucosamine-6-phosphate isomerase/deaminase
VNSPGGLDSAMFILVFGSAKAARLSQLAARPVETTVKVKVIAKRKDFINCSLFIRDGIAV